MISRFHVSPVRVDYGLCEMRRQSWPCFEVYHGTWAIWVSKDSSSWASPHFVSTLLSAGREPGNLRERQPWNGTTVPRSPNRTRPCTIDHRERRKRFPGELRISLKCNYIALYFVIGKSTEKKRLLTPFTNISSIECFTELWISKE